MIRIAVSACLLGNKVRYDGGHKQHELLGILYKTTGVEFVGFCPEAILGVPRSPIHLTLSPSGDMDVARVDNGQSVSRKLRSSIDDVLADLQSSNIRGVICKSRSPSCALRDADYNTPGKEGPGLLIQAIRKAFPQVPIIDENDVDDPDKLREFLNLLSMDQK